MRVLANKIAKIQIKKNFVLRKKVMYCVFLKVYRMSQLAFVSEIRIVVFAFRTHMKRQKPRIRAAR